eukprot:TRINITY_DN46976_c0_g1_i1.p1 TRINITY_DN46976_c0_g1~~TRINITY_DN46976_c0_g1_i1.p1  ORF type:complete len:557 (+),score=122.12 TRINITY_DN46976_c0_g1_i1:54-1724(+)
MTLLLSRSDIEKKISYPPTMRKQAKLPPLRSDLSMSVLNTYRQSVKEKKRNEMKQAPMLNFDIVAANKGQLADPTAASTYEEGLALKEQGELEDAKTLLLESVKMGIDTPEVYVNIGEVYKAQGMPIEAIKYFTKSLELSPGQFGDGVWGHVGAFKQRGECYLMLAGNDETATMKAAEEFDKYMQIEQPEFDDLVVAGKAHLDSGNLTRSEELLQAALQINPNDAYLHFNMGELNEKKHDVKTAKFHFSQALACDEDFPKPYLNRAEELLRQQDVPGDENQHLVDALNLCLSVLKLLPTDGPLHLKISNIYDRLGEAYVDSSLAMLTRGLQLSLPDEVMAGAYCRRGVIYIEKEKLDEAISDFTMGLSVDPHHVESLLNRASTYLQRQADGDAHAAATDYETVTSIPSVPPSSLRAPYIYLALWYFDKRLDPKSSYTGLLEKSFHCFTQAYFKGEPLTDHKEKLMVACAVAMNFYPLPEGSPDLQYEELAARSSLALKLLERYYLGRRRLEPTAHSALFVEFQNGCREVKGFGRFHDALERIKGGNEAAKGKKKKK